MVYFINTHTFAAMDFGRRLGASDEHIPQRICKERATAPPAKRHAALWVAPNLARGFVARSVGYRCGYTPSLAPRHGPNWAQRTSSYLCLRPLSFSNDRCLCTNSISSNLLWCLRNNYTFVALKLAWGEARRKECIPSDTRYFGDTTL